MLLHTQALRDTAYSSTSSSAPPSMPSARLALAADFLALYVYLYLPGWCASPHSAMRAFLDGASGLRERLRPPL